MLLAFRHENGFTIFTLTGIFFGSILELLQGFQTISAWFHVQDVNEAQRQFIKLRDLADKYPETYGSLPDFWSVSTKAGNTRTSSKLDGMECQDDIEDIGNEMEGEADMDAGGEDMGFDGGMDADLEAEAMDAGAEGGDNM